MHSVLLQLAVVPAGTIVPLKMAAVQTFWTREPVQRLTAQELVTAQEPAFIPRVETTLRTLTHKHTPKKNQARRPGSLQHLQRVVFLAARKPELILQLNRTDDNESKHGRQKEDVHKSLLRQGKFVLRCCPAAPRSL
jgi:hypothetical protein